MLPMLHCQEVRWALESLGIWQCHEIQVVRAGYTRQLVVTPDHCSLFLVFNDQWAVQHAMDRLHGRHIVGISKEGNRKGFLAFT